MKCFFDSVAKSGICWSWLILLLIGIDQLTKRIAVGLFANISHFKINQFLNLTLVKNPGAAFSFMANGHAWQILLLSAFAISVICLLLYWLYKSKFDATLYNISLVFIVSGATGNLIDRFKYGAVIDFIDLHISHFHWPTFNFADIIISIGAITYFFVNRKSGIDRI